MVCASPFVKWAGGKRQLLSAIWDVLPEGLGDNLYRYVEPFVGGGALLFDLLGTYDFHSVVINDKNKVLVTAYKCIKKNVGDVIESLTMLQDCVRRICDGKERKLYWLSERKRYNTFLKNGWDDDVEMSSLFLFMNKTCFNGMYRLNSDGMFNSAYGYDGFSEICNPVNLHNVSRALDKVDILCGDYHDVLHYMDSHTFAYFDPPYRPLNQKQGIWNYTDDCFNDEEQQKLSEFVHYIDKKGVKILLSNSNPKNTNKTDVFFDELYGDMKMQNVSAIRRINGDGKGRGKIGEILVRNYSVGFEI